MKWIKADKADYIVGKKYYGKWDSGTVIKSTGVFNGYGDFIWSEKGYIPISKKELNQLLILDESDDHPTPKVSAEEVLEELTGIDLANRAADYAFNLLNSEPTDFMYVRDVVIKAFTDGYTASQFRTPVPEGEKAEDITNSLSNSFYKETGNYFDEDYSKYCQWLENKIVEYRQYVAAPANGEGKDEWSAQYVFDKTFVAFVAGYANPQLDATELISFHKDWFEKTTPAKQ